ncbi:MAG: DUF3015 family protein [Nitrospira sp.]|nr:DUF3015 family protein [Nitrospira sp.]MBS0164718.1 DUF3015 family protein [Nitrospira sp.]
MVMSRMCVLVLATAGLLIGQVGCDATKEAVKAPFDATTAVSNGTTQASSEFTQPSKEFTSSTTPGSRVGSEDLIRAKQRLHLFAKYNHANLQHEIAQGQGEYLTSLITLAQVPTERHAQVFADLQHKYPLLYPNTDPSAETTERLVETVWLKPLGTHE